MRGFIWRCYCYFDIRIVEYPSAASIFVSFHQRTLDPVALLCVGVVLHPSVAYTRTRPTWEAEEPSSCPITLGGFNLSSRLQRSKTVRRCRHSPKLEVEGRIQLPEGRLPPEFGRLRRLEAPYLTLPDIARQIHLL